MSEQLANLTRGVRNNNPGNVRLGTQWNGLLPQQTDGAFCQFVSAPYGIRVIIKLLWAYQDFHDLTTVRGIIDRWAPPSENVTSAYAAYVAEHAGLGLDQAINLHQDEEHLMAMVKAIIAYENGGFAYAPDILTAALALAKT